jgi:cytochrome c oxidase cbb3-type subunit III
MKRNISFIILTILIVTNAFGQGVDGAASGFPTALLWIFYLVLGLLLLITYTLFIVSKELKRFVLRKNETEEAKMWDSRSSWEKIFQLKPVGTDTDTVINEPHDGIYELDNPPPPWFMFLFFGCIAISAIYFIRFSLTDYGYSQEDEYIAEVQAAEVKQTANLVAEDQNIDENSVVALTDITEIDAGKMVYIQNCKVCHDEGGKGNTGPNLTDEYWKHGGSTKEIFKTIKYGVVDKGMRAWADDLSPKKIQQVVSYIMSLQGSKPEGAKAPEGDKWVPEELPRSGGSDSTAQGNMANN